MILLPRAKLRSSVSVTADPNCVALEDALCTYMMPNAEGLRRRVAVTK